MVNYVVGFDVDGVLRSYRDTNKVIPIEEMRTFLIILTRFRNVHVVVWSAQGKEYAKRMVKELGLSEYVTTVYDKNDTGVDIAIDDKLDFDDATFNLIYNEAHRPVKEDW